MPVSHKDLQVWRAAVVLARDTYKLTTRFPREEQFGITAQMRRSAVSIASNIAEGAARHGTKEFLQYLYVGVWFSKRAVHSGGNSESTIRRRRRRDAESAE